MDSPQPTLHFYRRDGCALCDEGRAALQAVLEERAATGLPVPHVKPVDVGSDQELERRHLATIPVLALGGHELALAVSPRHIRSFLARTLDQAVA
ncbi:MAG: glutaredoxin family protein [Chloroflexi bacterium]|nr:glutaredoxin family protein [Chloroflexota bacterium]